MANNQIPNISSSLPLPVRPALERFCEQLIERLEGLVISIVLYGGLAKGEFTPGKSDVNLMVVVADVSIETLEEISLALDQARQEIKLNLLTVTPDDLEDSAEVFPIKFLDIQRNHQILWGGNVAQGLKVPKDRLRRQSARELMNLQLRLRQFYLERWRRPELIERTLHDATSTLLINLAVLIELKTGRIIAAKPAVVEAAEGMGFEGKWLESFLSLKRGELRPSASELKDLYGWFMVTVTKAVELLDKL